MSLSPSDLRRHLTRASQTLLDLTTLRARLARVIEAFSELDTHPEDHASYYPGASTMAIKLLVDAEDGTILGAQAVGPAGADKRIDVIATAMRAGLTAPDLIDLELAYAPPFGSAKDPINQLGYVAENRLSGLSPSADWSEVDQLRAQGWRVLDVRTPEEFAAPCAIRIATITTIITVRPKCCGFEGSAVSSGATTNKLSATIGRSTPDSIGRG